MGCGRFLCNCGKFKMTATTSPPRLNSFRFTDRSPHYCIRHPPCDQLQSSGGTETNHSQCCVLGPRILLDFDLTMWPLFTQRILYMPPVFAIISFFSYRFFRSYTYVLFLRGLGRGPGY